MSHPNSSELALYAGGDLPLPRRWVLRRHVEGCADCSAEIDAFRQARVRLADEVCELPAGLRWERLAEEMTGNIHVGLEAAECVAAAPQRRAPLLNWRSLTAGAVASLMLGAAWFLNPPPKPAHLLTRAAQPEIRTIPAGLELEANGNALVLMHRAGGDEGRAIIISSPGTLRARYADGDTGQITINNVYTD